MYMYMDMDKDIQIGVILGSIWGHPGVNLSEMTQLSFYVLVRKKKMAGKKGVQICRPGLPDRSPTSPGPLLRFLESIYKIEMRKKKIGKVIEFFGSTLRPPPPRTRLKLGEY